MESNKIYSILYYLSLTWSQQLILVVLTGKKVENIKVLMGVLLKL